MAKCDLTIELDDPETVHPGGGTITGVVHVRVDADVNCKGLEVQSGWRTHGRGNVAADTTATMTLFAGEWNAGESVEYRFELPIANWPPSYHGHHLNIDHYVDARAKIPWGIDPKASAPFMMRPSRGPEGLKTQSIKNAIEVKGPIGCVIAMVILGIVMLGFGAILVELGIFALFFLIVPLAGFGYWFFRFFLPKFLLGEVQYQLASENVSPGQEMTGELIIRPRRNVSINGVTLKFQAREQCVSGSGSNRTTHKHVFVEQLDTLQGSTTLMAGQEHRFPFSVQLPDNAPYSIDLDDNDLIWSTTLRVDIPRWPDWVKEIPIMVVPSGKPVEIQPHQPPQAAAVAAQDDPSDGGITFGETASHLWSVRGDRDQLETLVEAVTGLTFELEAQVERRLLYAGDDDPHVYKDGYAVWARYTDPELPMVLYVPHELADEFEQIGRDLWRGRGTIVGWDSLHNRLQVKLLTPQ